MSSVFDKKNRYKHIYFWPGILNFSVHWSVLKRARGKSLGNISASRQSSSSLWVTIHTTWKRICQKEQISLLFPGWDTKDPPHTHTPHTHTHTHTPTYPWDVVCPFTINTQDRVTPKKVKNRWMWEPTWLIPLARALSSFWVHLNPFQTEPSLWNPTPNTGLMGRRGCGWRDQEHGGGKAGHVVKGDVSDRFCVRYVRAVFIP